MKKLLLVLAVLLLNGAIFTLLAPAEVRIGHAAAAPRAVQTPGTPALPGTPAPPGARATRAPIALLPGRSLPPAALVSSPAGVCNPGGEMPDPRNDVASALIDVVQVTSNPDQGFWLWLRKAPEYFTLHGAPEQEYRWFILADVDNNPGTGSQDARYLGADHGILMWTDPGASGSASFASHVNKWLVYPMGNGEWAGETEVYAQADGSVFNTIYLPYAQIPGLNANSRLFFETFDYANGARLTDRSDSCGSSCPLPTAPPTAAAGPANDDIAQAQTLSEPPPNGQAVQILNPDTRGATVAWDDPVMGCGAGVNSNTVWFRLTPTYYGRLRLRTFSELDPNASSSYDTVLAVYTGQRGSLQRLGCNDDAPGRLQSELSLDVTSGQTYYIEVAQKGSAAGGGRLSLFAQYLVQPKPWTLMFYLAGDNDAEMDEALRWLRDRLPDAAKNLNVNVVAFWDGLGEGARYQAYAPTAPASVALGEVSTGSPVVLADFLRWSARNYPAQHYALVIADHGHGLSGVAKDDHPNPGDYLDPRDLRAALSSWDVPFLDVLYLNACLMATLDSQRQVSGRVNYYVASESIAFVPPIPSLFVYGAQDIPAITPNTQPRDLAQALAFAYQATYARPEYPSTISVVDMEYNFHVAVTASALAARLRENMSVARSGLDRARREAQRYEDNGDWVINDDDRVVDLYHFTQLVRNYVPVASVQSAADTLLAWLDRYVVYSHGWSGSYKGRYWVHNNSHGVTAFFPSYAARACFYNGDWIEFAAGASWGCTHALNQDAAQAAPQAEFDWGPMLVEFTRQMNPAAPADPRVPALVGVTEASKPVYLPVVLAGSGHPPDVLLRDDFSQPVADNWTPTSGSWSIENGEYSQRSTDEVAWSWAGSHSWTDYEVRARVQLLSAEREAALGVRATNGSVYYFCLAGRADRLTIAKMVGGTDYFNLAWAPWTAEQGRWYDVRVVVQGQRLLAYLDGQLIFDYYAADMQDHGMIGLRTYYTHAHFDDVTVAAR